MQFISRFYQHYILLKLGISQKTKVEFFKGGVHVPPVPITGDAPVGDVVSACSGNGKEQIAEKILKGTSNTMSNRLHSAEEIQQTAAGIQC